MRDSNWHRRVTCPAIVLLLLAGTAIAGDLQQGIDACAEIGDDEIRLACFDALVSAKNSGNLPAVAEPAEPAETPTATPAVAAGTTAAGSAADAQVQSPPIIAQAPDEAKEKDVFNVRLTRCAETSASGRQVYYLDNGEIWRQSNNSRKNVRNCDTAVTIEKDMFGYKMHVPSEKRSIRISPVR